MKKLLLIASLSVAAHVSFAQKNTRLPEGSNAQQNLNQLLSNDVTGVVNVFDGRYTGVKGSPYFLPSWGKGALFLPSNTAYENLELKYNVYENNLLFRKVDGVELILEPSNISYFTLTDSLGAKKYTFKKILGVTGQDSKKANQFFLMLHEGPKALLVMHPKKSLVKADFKGAYDAGKPYDELMNEYTYYIVKNNAMEKVKLTRKNLLKVLSDKQSDVQAFLAKEKLDTSTEEGWSKTLAFYETL